jgi:hypothetical protein
MINKNGTACFYTIIGNKGHHLKGIAINIAIKVNLKQKFCFNEQKMYF